MSADVHGTCGMTILSCWSRVGGGGEMDGLIDRIGGGLLFARSSLIGLVSGCFYAGG